MLAALGGCEDLGLFGAQVAEVFFGLRDEARGRDQHQVRLAAHLSIASLLMGLVLYAPHFGLLNAAGRLIIPK